MDSSRDRNTRRAPTFFRDARKQVAGVAVGILVMGSTVSSALACAAGDLNAEVVAKAVRTLQSDLMVAALSCGSKDPYNRFIQTYNPHLSAQGELLKTYFRNRHKSGHRKALNSYVTTLANQGAIRMAVTGQRFCERADVMHSHLGKGTTDERLKVAALAYAASVVPDLADEIDRLTTIENCTVRKVAFGDRGMKPRLN